MKYLFIFLITAVSYGQVEPLTSDSRPAPTASRPSKWLIGQAEKLKEAGDKLNAARATALSLQMEKPSGSYYEKKEHLNNRSNAFRAMIASMKELITVEETFAAGIAENKDNDFGWTVVGNGVEIKLIPGWYESRKVTKQQLVRCDEIDVDMMNLFDSDCYNRYVQPVLIKTDPKKADAFKVVLGFGDKFNTMIATAELRRDTISSKSEVVLLTLQDRDDGKNTSEQVYARIKSSKYEVPYTVISKEVIPRMEEEQ